MTCRHCGTEIAQKALICYRCGHATSAPAVRPPKAESLFAPRRRSPMPLVVAVIVVAVAALLAGMWLAG